MDKQPSPQDQTEREEDFQQHIDTMLAAERKTRTKWALIGVVLALGSVGLFVLFAEYRTFFFRPKPNMQEVERVALQKTNDPVCRTLLEHVDALKDDWRAHQVEMRTLHESTDVAAIEEGRERIAQMVTRYKVEQKRRELIIAKEDRVHNELAAYFKHVLFFLDRMDALLQARAESLTAPPEAADAGAIAERSDAGAQSDAGEAREAESAQDTYTRAWRNVTEDHDKWRVYRQGPIPCGQRTGPVPELPPAPSALGEASGADAGALDAN